MTCIVCRNPLSDIPVETMDNSGKLVMRITCRYCGTNNSDTYHPGINVNAIGDPAAAAREAVARDSSVKRSLKGKR